MWSTSYIYTHEMLHKQAPKGNQQGKYVFLLSQLFFFFFISFSSYVYFLLIRKGLPLWREILALGLCEFLVLQEYQIVGPWETTVNANVSSRVVVHSLKDRTLAVPFLCTVFRFKFCVLFFAAFVLYEDGTGDQYTKHYQLSELRSMNLRIPFK